MYRGYEIYNKHTLRVVKVGISDDRIKLNGKSARVERQVRNFNQAYGNNYAAFSSHIGKLFWQMNHKVVLMDKLNRGGWKTTFLEKEDSSKLFWKIERMSDL